MAAGGHFGCPKITFDLISGHFRSIRNFNFLWILLTKCRPFWMSEIHFRSHFRPFQIDRPFWFSEIHFRSQFWLFEIAISFSGGHFGFWKSLWITFLAISDRYATFCIFWQNGRRRPFWMGRQCQLSNLSEIFGWVMHVSSLKNVV